MFTNVPNFLLYKILINGILKIYEINSKTSIRKVEVSKNV